MKVYRFCHERFCHDMSGEGARQKGGRWNPPGVPVVYASEHISLALLEVVANAVKETAVRTGVAQRATATIDASAIYR